jgi:hypothetical protein
VARLTILKHSANGFEGEHGDAYETGAVMGLVLLCAVICAISGCFWIHAHHTSKAEYTPTKGKGAVAPAPPGALKVRLVPRALAIGACRCRRWPLGMGGTDCSPALAPLSPPLRFLSFPAPPRSQNAVAISIEGKVIQIATDKDGQLCALTDDGRVYTWTARDAAKARGALEASLVEESIESAPPQARTERAVSKPPPSVPQTPTRPRAAAERLESPPPKSPSAATRPGGTRSKPSISELKRSVNTIRAVN